MDKIYVDTVRLLLDTAPYVFHSDRFALKGGTALNLFVREMPLAPQRGPKQLPLLFP